MVRIKHECCECKVMTKRFRKYKGKEYCFNCCRKNFHIIGSFNTDNYSKIKIKFKRALEKTYEVKGYFNKSTGYINSSIIVPNVLVGHKVKLIIIREDENENRHTKKSK